MCRNTIIWILSVFICKTVFFCRNVSIFVLQQYLSCFKLMIYIYCCKYRKEIHCHRTLIPDIWYMSFLIKYLGSHGSSCSQQLIVIKRSHVLQAVTYENFANYFLKTTSTLETFVWSWIIDISLFFSWKSKTFNSGLSMKLLADLRYKGNQLISTFLNRITTISFALLSKQRFKCFEHDMPRFLCRITWN